MVPTESSRVILQAPRNYAGIAYSSQVKERDMRDLGVAFCSVVFAFTGDSVVAQGNWPTHGDVLDRGNELSERELTGLLSSSSAVVVLELEGPIFGRVFSCQGDDSLLFTFIPPSTSTAADSDVVPCEVVGSSICFDLRGEWNHCLAVRRLPDSALLYSGFVDEDLPGLRDVPAQVLGILPFEIHRLEEPSGEFDLGPVAISLPQDVDWEFREGMGLPLSLKFGAGPRYAGGIEASISIIGWPAPIAGSPGDREPESGEREIAEGKVAAWEEGSREGASEAIQIDSPAGPCVRIREHRLPKEGENGTGEDLPENAGFQQYCVTPSGGAELLVKTSLRSVTSSEQLVSFEETSLAILDSLRLGYEIDQ